MRLWSGAELWVDPEIDQGFGLSGTLGVAGFPSGEAYKVGEPVPYARIQRAFVRQTIDLGGDMQKVDDAANQFGGSQTANRLVITIGKFSVTDIFDTNKYAHDPRGDFMNWAIVDTGTFDYAADAWGYTYGAAAEWYQGDWTVRGGVFDHVDRAEQHRSRSDVRTVPVGRRDRAAIQHMGAAGQDRRHRIPHPRPHGQFRRRYRLGAGDRRHAPISPRCAITTAAAASASIWSSRSPRNSASSRAPASPTAISSLTTSPISTGPASPASRSTASNGAAPTIRSSVAGVVNGITKVHEEFLNNGGLGILIGDGMLPHPGPEQIIETYYNSPCRHRPV